MIEVITKAEHKYADRKRAVGDRYFVQDRLLPAMKHLGWVEELNNPGKRVGKRKQKKGS